MSVILKASNINKIYDDGAVHTQVLTGLDLNISVVTGRARITGSGP